MTTTAWKPGDVLFHESWGVVWQVDRVDKDTYYGHALHDNGTMGPCWHYGMRIDFPVVCKFSTDCRPLTPVEQVVYSLEGVTLCQSA